MADRDELLKFVTNVDWDKHADDQEVVSTLEAIKGHVDDFGEDGEYMEDEVEQTRAKLVVVGDGAVGKTCLLISFATDKFPDEYVPTVFENYTAEMRYKDENIYLALWDTAGQEDYDRLRPLSYPGTDVVLLCFSVVSEASYEAISDKWSPEVNHYIPDVPHILVGTKVDLRDSKTADAHVGEFQCITREQGEELAEDIGAIAYVEASAKTRKGLEEVYLAAVEAVLKQRAEQASEEEEPVVKKPSKSSKSKSSSSKSKSSKSSSKKEEKKSSSRKDKKEKKEKEKKEKKSKGKGKREDPPSTPAPAPPSAPAAPPASAAPPSRAPAPPPAPAPPAAPPPPMAPAPPSAPPPPAAGSPAPPRAAGGGGGALAAIAAGVSLSHVSAEDRKPANKTTSLLSSIQQGVQLRKVEVQEKEVKADSGAFDVAKILARRAAMEFSDSDSDGDDDDWD